MTINEYLQKVRPERQEMVGVIFERPRPRLKCRDGYSVSVQANEYAYCCPRENGMPYYSEVELGYPSVYDELLDDYIEDPENPTETVYGYVPVEVVDKLIEKHGGIIFEEEES